MSYSYQYIVLKIIPRAGRWVKVLAMSWDELSSTPRIHCERRELLSVVLTSMHVSCTHHTHTYIIHIHTHIQSRPIHTHMHIICTYTYSHDTYIHSIPTKHHTYTLIKIKCFEVVYYVPLRNLSFHPEKAVLYIEK